MLHKHNLTWSFLGVEAQAVSIASLTLPAGRSRPTEAFLRWWRKPRKHEVLQRCQQNVWSEDV